VISISTVLYVLKKNKEFGKIDNLGNKKHQKNSEAVVSLIIKIYYQKRYLSQRKNSKKLRDKRMFLFHTIRNIYKSIRL
jgi:hypothetical protein